MTDKTINAPQEPSFSDIAQLITAARQRAVQAVNTTLIELYCQIGQHISRKIAAAEWGDGVVEQLARYLAQTQPGLRGFTRRNLFRMRHFYEAYPDAEIVSALLTQLPWTHHLIILSQSKRPEEREFYLRLAAQEKWSSRHEHTAIGVLLCASKDDEVVEYALSRSTSPALIAQYQTQLPDKALLRAKLHEFYQQNTQALDEDKE
jgi:predicted nuclease of restriction endonuclease-like (RecB) superfamily